eukprot:TRINITY_DN11147_c1_g1_i2.p1 TRINITY_DN11147_c1_g1~~TRINITY_DN11147_c1_g1_i2.p1  ORF type:complete len:282 (+),score=47.99 TRINITY_DN11147_c1_g1_i2:69-914(+)
MAAQPATAVVQVYIRAERQGGAAEACLRLQPEHVTLKQLLASALDGADLQGPWSVDSSADGLRWTAGDIDLPVEAVVGDYGHKFFVFVREGADRPRALRRSRSRTPVAPGAGTAPGSNRCVGWLRAQAGPAWQRRAQWLRLALLALAGALPAAACVWGYSRYIGGDARPADAAPGHPAPSPAAARAQGSAPPPPPPPRPAPTQAAPSQAQPQAAAAAVVDVATAMQTYARVHGAEEAVTVALRELSAVQSHAPEGQQLLRVEAVTARWLAASLLNASRGPK